MKKGDLKKQEILQTAETLFCRNGYEETSIQDILDILHTSKGSFYHHYASKEQLLEAMCDQRATVLAEQAAAEAVSGDAVKDMNTLLSGMMPLRGERLTFLLMLLPVFALPEGRNVRSAYCHALTEAFYPPVRETVDQGNQSDAFFCTWPDVQAKICLRLANDLWCDICEEILRCEEAGTLADPGDLLSLLDPVRNIIEKILGAPYGCLEIMNLTELKMLTEQIHLHWRQGKKG